MASLFLLGKSLAKLRKISSRLKDLGMNQRYRRGHDCTGF
jgi:hypothetical protein